MTGERDEKLSEREFDEFLAGRSPVARGYDRLRDVEPPAHLDRAVLTEARVAATETRRRPSAWSLWAPRVAVAAVLVLAVGVILRLTIGPDGQPVVEGMGSDPEQRLGEDLAERIDRPDDYVSAAPESPAESDDDRARWLEEEAASLARSTEAFAPDALIVAPKAADQADVGGLRSATVAQAEQQAARRSPAEGDDVPPESVTVTGFSLAEADPAPWRARPKAWLTRIDALIEDGEDEAARRELAEFVDAWPEYELDEAYDDWLPEPNPNLP